MSTRPARRRLAPRGAGLLVVALVSLPGAIAVGETASWSAGAATMQVWTDHVFGTEPSPGDGITDGRGWFAWKPVAALRLAANGRLLRFRDNPDLDHGYVTVMAEAMPTARGAQTRWQGGIAQAWRLNDELYEPFDYRDTNAYLSARHYLATGFSAQLRGDAFWRTYPDQPVEDARKAWLSLRLQKSLPTRTSLTLSLRSGWKDYREQAQAPAAVGEVGLQAAQSLSPRLALRAWGSLSNLYEHGDSAAQLAAFDNPLMDEFSSDGGRFGAALKVITPWNVTAEVSGERARLDYPGRPPAVYDAAMNLFMLDGEGLALAEGERSDTITRARLAVERPGVRLGGRAQLDLNFAVEWNDAESNDLYWQWSGWSAQAGASIGF